MNVRYRRPPYTARVVCPDLRTATVAYYYAETDGEAVALYDVLREAGRAARVEMRKRGGDWTTAAVPPKGGAV